MDKVYILEILAAEYYLKQRFPESPALISDVAVGWRVTWDIFLEYHLALTLVLQGLLLQCTRSLYFVSGSLVPSMKAQIPLMKFLEGSHGCILEKFKMKIPQAVRF